MNGEIYDARQYLSQWLTAMERQFVGFERSVRVLTAARCDRYSLGWLLNGLSSANAADRLSREEVRDLSDSLRSTANSVRNLRGSQLNRLVASDIDLTVLDAQLAELSSRLRKIEQQVNKRRPMGRDLFRAALVHYVHETTDAYKDDDVAALISLAEDADDYTTDAHVHWRTRASAQGFLSGPSPDVLDLLDEMNRDLAV
jgi:hypothetical protein